SADYLVQAPDITPSGGSYSLTVQPGRVYTVTTTTGQGKGTATSGGQAGMKLPYSDSFESYAVGSEATYLMDWQGAFEVGGCAGGTITAKLDGATLGTTNNSTWATGQVGYATSQGETAQFDNLSVGNGTPVSSVTVTNPGGQSGTVGTAITALQIHATDSTPG